MTAAYPVPPPPHGTQTRPRSAKAPSSSQITSVAANVRTRPSSAKSAGCRVRAPPPLQEELQPPPLGDIPWQAATVLERHFAKTLGMGEMQMAMRLPPDTEVCPLGGRCCWRWLARGAIERVMDRTVSHLTLSDAVKSSAEELEEVRFQAADCVELRALRDRGLQDSRDLAALRVKHQELEVQVQDLKGYRDEYNKVLVEKNEVQEANTRHVAAQRGLEKVVACLQHQQRVLVDSDLFNARKRFEDAERKVGRAEQERDQLLRRVDAAGREIEAQKINIGRLERTIETLSKKPRTRSPANQNTRTNSKTRPGSAPSSRLHAAMGGNPGRGLR